MPPLSSGWAARFRRSATRKAAPSCAAAQGCGKPEGPSERRHSANDEARWVLWCALASGATVSRGTHTHARSTFAQAGASACEGVVAMSVHFSSASGWATTATARMRKRRRSAKSVARGGNYASRLTGCCSQPGAGLWASLRQEKGASGWRHGWQQRAFAKVKVAYTRCTVTQALPDRSNEVDDHPHQLLPNKGHSCQPSA